MKHASILSVSVILLSMLALSIATAAEPQQQPSCHIPYELAGWEVSAPKAYSVIDKRISLQQNIPPGELLLYISFKDVKRMYNATEQILLKDRSPLNPDSKIETGDTLLTTLTITNIRDNTSLDVVTVPGGFLSSKMFPIKSNGYICADEIGTNSNKKLTTVGMPVVLQGAPLTQSIVDFSGAKTCSIAIVLQKLEGAVAEVEATLMVNGKKVKSVSQGCDVFSGQIDLSGLTLAIKKEAGSLKVISISEPGNYYSWISTFFNVGI
jgi:hypothetical protein